MLLKDLSSSKRLAVVLLITILAIAAGLRFYNLGWDGETFAHPDERSTVVYYAPTIKWPEEAGAWLDPDRSTLNPFLDINNPDAPRSYTYGHFPLYILVLIANFCHALAPGAASLGLPVEVVHFFETSLSGQGFALIGRGLMALADLVSVYLLFLIGRRLYGRWGGLLAAALSAFTVLQIQLAHFFAVDPVSTTFTLLAIYGSMLLYDRRSKGAAAVAGVGVALAVASKFSALPIVFAPLVAGFLAVVHYKPESQAADTAAKTRFQNKMVGLIVFSLGLAFVIFTITSPFVLLDFDNFRRAVLDEQGNMVSGVADMPYTRQYRGTTAYWYFIEQQLRWGMGWPLGLLALAGAVWVVIKAIRGKAQPGEWIALTWLVLYFGPTGLFLAKFMRYMAPVTPLLTLFGAGLVVALWRYKTHNPGYTRPGQRPTTPVSPGQARQANDQPYEQLWAVSEAADQESSQGRSSPHLPTFQSPNLSTAYSPLLTRGLALTLAAVALTGAAVWSLAFVNGVYGTEHPWVTFARWTYANVPDGACIAREHWDEGIPASIPEPGGHPGAHGYRQPELTMYNEDTQEKYEYLRSTLMNCDYIAIASNRLWRTIPKLPERYPLSVRYYEALFSGELGFEPVYTVETPPRLGPLVFDDQAADESFTVYDHPQPIMFKKTRQLSPEAWDAILGNTWQSAAPWYVGEPTLLMRLRGAARTPAAPVEVEQETGKSLLLDTPVDQLPVVSDYRWNNLANNSTVIAVVWWWLAVVLIGLLAWPLTFLLFYKLPDRGYAFSKSLGVLLVSYLVWLSSSTGLLYNTIFTAIMALSMVGGFSLWAAINQRRDLLQFLKRRRLAIFLAEAVFGAVYLFFIYLRILNPDLWQPWLGGEKMLEIGFLNAIVKSATMPPYDPFFANGIINYYYYGLFLVGVIIKLTGIQPSIAFNLAIAMLAGLTAANVFNLAGNLALAGSPFKHLTAKHVNRAWPHLSYIQTGDMQSSKYIIAGLVGVLFVIFTGNLEGAAQLLRDLGRLETSSTFTSAIPGLETFVLALGGLVNLTTNGATVAVYNYWDPTRVIPQTINEFPYFSFLFADLHPHMIGLPFTVLFLSLAYHWLRPTNDQRRMTTLVLPGQADERTWLRQDKQLTNDDDSDKQAITSSASPSSLITHHSSRTTHHAPRFLSHSQFTIHNSLFTNSSLLHWLALPFVLGAIAAINTWDLPTYLGLMLATFLLARYRQVNGQFSLLQGIRLLLSSGIFTGATLAVTYLLYLPFFANYQPPAETGVGWVYTKTPLDQHLKIWGFFIFIILSWLVVSLRQPNTRNSLLRSLSLGWRRWNVWPHLSQLYQQMIRRRAGWSSFAAWGVGLAVIISFILFLLGYTVPAYLFPLILLALLLLFRPEIRAETAYLGLLVFTGLLVLLGVEFFFLRDFLGGGEYYRMNTLFKFFIQVWVLFGLMTAVALPQLWQWVQTRWSLSGQIAWQGATLLLLLAVLVYPIFGTQTRVDDRFPGDANRPAIGTLDGLAYMTVGVFDFDFPYGSGNFNRVELKYDYEAIRWLQENVQGTPIIAEAKIGYYREGGMRVAAYTGLPSILGGLHQNEQRYPWQIGERDFVVNEFWSTPDPQRTLDLIDRLSISYIYIGQIERLIYGTFVEDKFEQLHQQGALELVFENEQTKIYQRTNGRN